MDEAKELKRAIIQGMNELVEKTFSTNMDARFACFAFHQLRKVGESVEVNVVTWGQALELRRNGDRLVSLNAEINQKCKTV